MLDITVLKNEFLQKLYAAFGNRVWFVGLQGSYGRGEATEKSDVDMVVILDVLSGQDLKTYHAMLDTMPHREMLCGFLSGKDEILNWEPSDLVQFYFDTKPIRGSLDDLLPLIDEAAVNRAIKTGACNIFHGCVHNMLYDKNDEILRGLYKSASFVVQAICYKQTGCYMSLMQDLLEKVSTEDRAVIETFIRLKNGAAIDFEEMSQTLFTWSQKQIETK